jgi:hypothetical protein
VNVSVVELLNDAVAIPSPIGLAITFVIAAIALGTLEFFFPAFRQKFWPREWRVDLAYWFFTPLFTKIATNAALVKLSRSKPPLRQRRQIRKRPQ